MRRREFLATAGGTAAAVGAASAASGTAGAQQQPEFGSYLEGAKGGNFKDLRGNSEVTVEVGADPKALAFAPTKIWIDPGTTVVFKWVSTGHNVLPKSKPSGSDWKGHDPLESSGFTYEHTFETKGIYTYYCRPHEQLGMKGGIAVGDVGGGSGSGGGGGGGGGEGGGGHGGGGKEQDPHEMGVPFRAHYVGIATILGIIASLVYTFYVLKYGESAHSASPNRK